MYIGEASKLSGASIKAIRLYEELGLLTAVQRLGNYRVYNNDHLVLLRLITKAKSLGFSLAEMKRFVERQPQQAPWDCILQMIESKQQQLAISIGKLQAQQTALASYRQSIESCLADNADCALDEAALDSTPRGRLQN